MNDSFKTQTHQKKKNNKNFNLQLRFMCTMKTDIQYKSLGFYARKAFLKLKCVFTLELLQNFAIYLKHLSGRHSNGVLK